MIIEYTAHLTPLPELDYPLFKLYTYLLLNLDCVLNINTVECHYNAIKYNVLLYMGLQRLGYIALTC